MYDMKKICVTRLFGLLCRLTSMSVISDEFNSEIKIKNLSKIYWKTLIRSKMFDKYKEYFQLIFDGTWLSNYDHNLNDNCLIRKHKNRKISYYKYLY